MSAGGNRVVSPSNPLVVDGSGSSDPDQATDLVYSWTVVPALSGAWSWDQPTLQVLEGSLATDTTYTFTLMVAPANASDPRPPEYSFVVIQGQVPYCYLLISLCSLPLYPLLCLRWIYR